MYLLCMCVFLMIIRYILNLYHLISKTILYTTVKFPLPTNINIILKIRPITSIDRNCSK